MRISDKQFESRGGATQSFNNTLSYGKSGSKEIDAEVQSSIDAFRKNPQSVPAKDFFRQLRSNMGIIDEQLV